VLLLAEIILILILMLALIALLIEEKGIKKSHIPKGTVEECWDGQERRRAVRIDTSFTVTYNIEKKTLRGQTKNLSSSGMRLLVNEKLFENTILKLEFTLPQSNETIHAEGKVIWSHGGFSERDDAGRRIFHAGIQFVTIKPKDLEKVISYIETAGQKERI